MEGEVVNMAPELPDDVLADKIFSKFGLEELLDLRQTCKQWNRVILRHRALPEGTPHLRQCVVQSFKRIRQVMPLPLPSPAAAAAAPDSDDAESSSWCTESGDEGTIDGWGDKQIRQLRAKDEAKAVSWDHFGCPIASHRPLPANDDWYYGMTPWAEEPDLQPHDCQSIKFMDAEGPFFLHLARLHSSTHPGASTGCWVVQNPLGMTYHMLPTPPEPDCVRAGHRFDLQRTMKLIPGAAADDAAASAAGVFNYRAVAVTVAVAKGRSKKEAWIYTHMYRRVTDDWTFLGRTDMSNRQLWPCTKHWRVRPHCFDGRWLYCSFRVERQEFNTWVWERLWALDTQVHAWKPISVEELHAHNPLPVDKLDAWLVSYSYVVCAGKLLAIARYGMSACSTNGHNNPKLSLRDQQVESISIYEYVHPRRHGVGTWSKLSDMPCAFLAQFRGFDHQACQYPVATPCIYFNGLSIYRGYNSFVALVFDMSMRDGKGDWAHIASAMIPTKLMEDAKDFKRGRFISMAPSRDALP